MLLEDCRPARGVTTICKNSIFALILGLLVCVSDIRLPGDVLHAEDVQTAETGASMAAMAGDPAGDADDLRFLDVTMATAVDPQGEPEPLPFDRIIHEAAGRYGLDANLIAAVIMAESQFNPSAVSKKGAKGLMQIMPVTADALDMTNVYCPEENIHAGSRHLKWPWTVRRGRPAGARRLQRRAAERDYLQGGPALPGNPGVHRQGHGPLLGDPEIRRRLLTATGAHGPWPPAGGGRKRLPRTGTRPSTLTGRGSAFNEPSALRV